MRQSRGRMSQQLGVGSPNMLSLRQCHCDKLDKYQVTSIENSDLTMRTPHCRDLVVCF